MIAGFVIWSAVTALIVGIGIWSLRSKKAVGFYSGTEPPEVTDVKKYNRAVAVLWFGYAAAFELIGITFLFPDIRAAGILTVTLGPVAITIALIVVYNRILAKYRRDP